jgi:hypothetical protein
MIQTQKSAISRIENHAEDIRRENKNIGGEVSPPASTAFGALGTPLSGVAPLVLQ